MFRFKKVAFCKSKSFYYTVLKYFLYTVIKPLTQFVTNFVIHRWYPFSQHLNSLKKCCEKGYHRCTMGWFENLCLSIRSQEFKAVNISLKIMVLPLNFSDESEILHRENSLTKNNLAPLALR